MKNILSIITFGVVLFSISSGLAYACMPVTDSSLTEEERTIQWYNEADDVVVAEVTAVEDVTRDGGMRKEYTFTPITTYKGEITKPFTRYSRTDSCGFFHNEGSTVALFLQSDSEEVSELTPYRSTYQGFDQADLLATMNEFLLDVATGTEVAASSSDMQEAQSETESPEETAGEQQQLLQQLRAQLLDLLRRLFSLKVGE